MRGDDKGNKKSGRVLTSTALFSMKLDANGDYLSLYNALCRANSNASLFVKTVTLIAGSRIDNIDIVTSCDCLCRAFRLTCCTIGAFFSNVKCHVVYSLKSYKKNIVYLEKEPY